MTGFREVEPLILGGMSLYFTEGGVDIIERHNSVRLQAADLSDIVNWLTDAVNAQTATCHKCGALCGQYICECPEECFGGRLLSDV